jgi:phenylpropionate dioxygenase-like ring-hydroxylating dioxygenase large terminal subunit
MVMTETTIEPFLRNAWYVAAWKHELDKGFVARTIMNEPLVIFRDQDGRAGALEDRCCHRGAPLSEGKLVEAGLQCGYHGLVFDVHGKCVEIPGQDNIPQAAKTRAYKVVEKQDFVWIWMGDAARADESLIIDFPYHDQPDKWPSRKSVMDIKCNYMMMVDNLMDLTHLAYVHTKTIGGSPAAHAELLAERTERGAHFVRWTSDTKPPPTYVRAVGFSGNVDRGRILNTSCPRACCSGLAQSTSAKARGRTANRTDFMCGSSTARRRARKIPAIIFGQL